VSKEEILNKLQDIFIDILENKEIILNYDTIYDDIPNWDSLTNIILIIEIEKKFNLKFKLEEIQSFKNISEICDNILVKIKNK